MEISAINSKQEPIFRIPVLMYIESNKQFEIKIAICKQTGSHDHGTVPYASAECKTMGYVYCPTSNQKYSACIKDTKC